MKFIELFFGKIYLPLFFACAYKFLNFFITMSLFFIPMAIFGLGLYVLIFFFQKIIYRSLKFADVKINIKSSDGRIQDERKFNLSLFLLLLFSVGVFILSWFGVDWIQNLTIRELQIPQKLFSIVKWSLDIFAVALSFAYYIYFLTKYVKN